MSLYGVGLEIEVKRISTQFKIFLQKKQKVGIKSLASIFKKADKNGNKVLDQEEFTNALAELNLFPKIVEIQALMKYYDKNGDGSISYEEFVAGLREPLNERRRSIAQKAFASLDKNNSGKIPVSGINNTYDVHAHPRFLNGSYTREQLVAEFLLNFESAKSGFVSLKEFIDHYSEVSMTYTHDDAFVSLVENQWCISEDEGAGVFKQQVEFIIGALRLKLRTMANESSEEFVLRGIFKDFDLDASGSLTINEFSGIFHKLAIACDRKYVSALFKKFDTNANGVIEFEEFANWMIYDAYK